MVGMVTKNPPDVGLSLRARRSFGEETSDEEVLSAVLNALHHNSGMPHDKVRVEVRRGHAFERCSRPGVRARLAEQAAATAPGVIEVMNQIILEG